MAQRRLVFFRLLFGIVGAVVVVAISNHPAIRVQIFEASSSETAHDLPAWRMPPWRNVGVGYCCR